MISPQRIARIKREHGLCPDQDLVAIRIARQLDALADRPRPYDPTYTLDRQIASARRSMGEARWAELNAEWEADLVEQGEG